MKLLYPVDGVSEVAVGLLGTEIIQNFQRHGGAQVLTKTAETFIKGIDVTKLAVVDFHRAVWVAWIQTFMNEMWSDRIVCECGRANEVVHDLSQMDIQALDIMDKVIKLKGPDPETFKPVEYEFVFKPITIKEYEDMQESDVEATTAIIRACTKQQTPKTEHLPLNLYAEIGKMLSPEIKNLGLFGVKETKCAKCEKPLFSQASIQNPRFLTPTTL